MDPRVVTILLPATRQPLRADPSRFRLEDYPGSGQSILVVDDVRMQRDVCVAMLRKLGYSATSVGSGEEAIEHLARHPVDLLVLDMIMEPGIDGLETYEAIVRTHPGLKAIIASGFAETEQVKQTQALGAGAYLRKPFSLEKLAVAVHTELHGSD